MDQTFLARPTVIEILANAGLYSSNMKRCKKDITILGENDNNERKNLKRKREIEQNKSNKKKRKN